MKKNLAPFDFYDRRVRTRNYTHLSHQPNNQATSSHRRPSSVATHAAQLVRRYGVASLFRTLMGLMMVANVRPAAWTHRWSRTVRVAICVRYLSGHILSRSLLSSHKWMWVACVRACVCLYVNHSPISALARMIILGVGCLLEWRHESLADLYDYIHIGLWAEACGGNKRLGIYGLNGLLDVRFCRSCEMIAKCKRAHRIYEVTRAYRYTMR